MSVLIAVRVYCCLRCYLPEWIYRYYVENYVVLAKNFILFKS